MAQSTAPWMSGVLADVGINEGSNKRQIDQFFRDVGQSWLADTPEIEAWCAAFAGSHLKRNGYRIPTGVAAVRAREYDGQVAQGVMVPQFGDLVLLNYGQQGVVDHVTFFIEPLDNGRIRCLGGNQSNSVKYSNFKKADVAGYYRPVRVSGAPNANPLPTPGPVEPPVSTGDPGRDPGSPSGGARESLIVRFFRWLAGLLERRRIRAGEDR